MCFVQDVGRHLAATSAIAAESRPHGEFRNIAHTIGSSALDSFIGDAETNADVHANDAQLRIRMIRI